MNRGLFAVLVCIVFSILFSGVFVTKESAQSAYKVLIDEGHSDWLVSANARTLIQALEDKGYYVDTLTGTVTKSTLDACDVFLVGTAWGPFTQSEMQAIQDFVKEGGGLWLMGLGWSWVAYKGSIYEYPMNQIAQRFGAFFNPDIIYDPTDNVPNGSVIFHLPFIYSHPVTKGVSIFAATASVFGTVSIQNGTVLIAGDADSYGSPEGPYHNPGMYPSVLAAIEYSSGKVIIGVGPFEDEHIDEYDNKILALNIVDWLATPLAHDRGRVLFDEGHGEWLFVNSSGRDFADYLRAIGYLVESTRSFPITYDLLKGFDVYVVPTAWGNFAQSEIDAILQFVADGGGLFLTGVGWSWVNPSQNRTMDNYPMNSISENFGIKFLEDSIYDPTSNYNATPYNPIFHEFAPDCPISRGIALVGGPISPTALKNITAGPQAVVFGDADSYAGSTYPPGTRPPLAMAATYGYGRVVCLGHEGYLATEDYNKDGIPNIRDYDNLQLGINIINWLARVRMDVTWGIGMGPYHIAVFCNDSVTSFNMNKTKRELSFIITADASGLCNITIPRCRLDSPFNVTMDGTPTLYTIAQNENDTSLIFVYASGTHSVNIAGTERGYIIGDLNGDGKVDMRDIGTAAKNFGHKEEDYP